MNTQVADLDKFLFRHNMVFVKPSENKNPASEQYLATLIKNISYMYHVFSEDVVKILRTFTVDELKEFETRISNILTNENIRCYRPFYKNFPQEVMEMDEAQLYINACMHYVSAEAHDALGESGTEQSFQDFMPDNEDVRSILDEMEGYTVIQIATEEKIRKMFYNFLASKTSLSEQQKSDVITMMQTMKYLLPDVIPFKENMAFILGYKMKQGCCTQELLTKYIKTTTDMLRVLVAYSDGDVSLAVNTKFVPMSNPIRRMVMGVLENLNLSEMKKYAKVWMRIGEFLHPRTKQNRKRFPNVSVAFQNVRENKFEQTLCGKINKVMEQEKDAVKASKILAVNNPGELARKLDWLLRNAENTQHVLDQFAEVAIKVSTPVLFAVRQNFMNRINHDDYRVAFPKGSLAKAFVYPEQRAVISGELSNSVIDICEKAIKKHFSKLPAIGKVYVDPSLVDYNIPFSMRSASAGKKTLIRGSRIPFGADDKTIRMFIWWKNGNDRTDVDLSAKILDEDWEQIGDMAYFNLRESFSCHSGDIVNAPNGAAEYIDINLEKFKEANTNARYVTMCINMYSSQNFSELPECSAGWMMRKGNPQSGQIFELSTVKNKIDVTAESRLVMPVVFDIIERKAIWMDLTLKSCSWSYEDRRVHRQRMNSRFVEALININGNNIRVNGSNIRLVSMAIANMKRPNLYDLFRLHVIARGGTFVESKENADVVFSQEDGITPFDVDTIINEYLT